MFYPVDIQSTRAEESWHCQGSEPRSPDAKTSMLLNNSDCVNKKKKYFTKIVSIEYHTEQ